MDLALLVRMCTKGAYFLFSSYYRDVGCNGMVMFLVAVLHPG